MHLKLYRAGTPMPLSDVIPMLENMGLKVIGEEPFEVNYLYGEHTGEIWVHDFAMESSSGAAIDLKTVREPFHEFFARVLEGQIADDGFNNLVMGAGLTWREILVLRAYCKFLLQSRIQFSQTYMEETLAKNPALAGYIVALFFAQFDPSGPVRPP